jgi:predicted nucleic acid-binding protein
VTFVDSNVPMYLVGADHPNKLAARRLLETAIAVQERLVTSAEVFQEILHRYVAIGRPEAIESAFTLLLGIADEVYPIEVGDVQGAQRILSGADAARLSARDALHLAVMARHGVTQILSFDRGFDNWPGVQRLGS